MIMWLVDKCRSLNKGRHTIVRETTPETGLTQSTRHFASFPRRGNDETGNLYSTRSLMNARGELLQPGDDLLDPTADCHKILRRISRHVSSLQPRHATQQNV